MQNFENLGLLPQLVSSVEKQGYTEPTPIQKAAIPTILNGGDLFATAPTGTGKTAAFAIPIIQQIIENPQKGVHALILAPTRELAHQISDNFRKYGSTIKLRIALVYGGVSQRRQVEDIRRGCQVIIATPGRLLDLIEQGHIDLSAINTWVLDECDRMLDMGFIGDIREIGRLMLNEKKQTLLFSATAPREIRILSQELLTDPAQIDIAPLNEEKPKITQWLFAVSRNDKFELLKEILDDEQVQNMLVFTKTKHGADRLVENLRNINEYAVAIHGDKSQRERTRNLDLFKDGRARILVATDVAARGVDVPALNHVLNFDMPQDPETYTHRIGRTGRAGTEGLAMSFCDQSEANLLEMIYKEHGTTDLVEVEHEYRIELLKKGRGGSRSGSSRNRGRGRDTGSRNGRSKDFSHRDGGFNRDDRRSFDRNENTPPARERSSDFVSREREPRAPRENREGSYFSNRNNDRGGFDRPRNFGDRDRNSGGRDGGFGGNRNERRGAGSDRPSYNTNRPSGDRDRNRSSFGGERRDRSFEGKVRQETQARQGSAFGNSRNNDRPERTERKAPFNGESRRSDSGAPTAEKSHHRGQANRKSFGSSSSRSRSSSSSGPKKNPAGHKNKYKVQSF